MNCVDKYQRYVAKLCEVIVGSMPEPQASHLLLCLKFYLFCTLTKQCTINWQIITLLLHVSTLLCHPQWVRS